MSPSERRTLGERRAGAVVFGVVVGAWTARAVLQWLLGLSGTWLLAGIAAAAVVCGLVCLGTVEARSRA